MNYKIFQLRDDTKERVRRLYMRLDVLGGAEAISPNDYNCVYEGKIASGDTGDVLESLFTRFNVEIPDDYRGRSLSVSDIVVLGDTAYYCDSVGWKVIPNFIQE